MPRKRNEGDGAPQSGTIAERTVAKLKKDKNIKDVIRSGGDTLLSDVPYYVSTQAPMIDYIIGQPGIPAGKLTTIFGLEGSGKSTLSYHLLAETQRMGGVGVLIDSEQRFTRERAAGFGLDADQLIVVDGATTEQSFDSIEKTIDLIREDEIDIPVTIVYDSLAGSVPEKRLEKDVGEAMVANVARLASAFIPRLKLKISRSKVALVIVNQQRTRINMSGDPRMQAYQQRMKVMGGRFSMIAEMTLIFESALMLHCSEVSKLGEDREHPTGIKSRVEVRKNGLAPREGWRAEMDIDFKHGLDKVSSAFELLETIGAIKHWNAGWYISRPSLNVDFDEDQTKFQRRSFEERLEAQPELRDMIAAAPTLWKQEA